MPSLNSPGFVAWMLWIASTALYTLMICGGAYFMFFSHRRFKRTEDRELFVQQILKDLDLLHARLIGRSERRYRRPTPSDPHLNTLIHLALAHVARYTDVLRGGKSWQSDEGRSSLETLLQARFLEEARTVRRDVPVPIPSDVWEARRSEFGGWPPLLSLKFPNPRQWEDQIVRLAKGDQIAGLDPTLTSGSLLLLEEIPSVPDALSDRMKMGWSRPIYVLRRGLQIAYGHLERDGNQFALLSGLLG